VSRARAGIRAGLCVLVVAAGAGLAAFGHRQVSLETGRLARDRRAELEARVERARRDLERVESRALGTLALLDLAAAERSELESAHPIVRGAFRIEGTTILRPRGVTGGAGALPWPVPEPAPSMRALAERIERWRAQGETERCLAALDDLLECASSPDVRREALLLQEVLRLASASEDPCDPTDGKDGAALEARVARIASDAPEPAHTAWMLAARLRLSDELARLGHAAAADALLVTNLEAMAANAAYFALGPALRFHRRAARERLARSGPGGALRDRVRAALERLAVLDAEAEFRAELERDLLPAILVAAQALADGGSERVAVETAGGAELVRVGRRVDERGSPVVEGFRLDRSALSDELARALAPEARLLAPGDPGADAPGSLVLEMGPGLPFVAVRPAGDELADFRRRRTLFYGLLLGAAFLGISGAAVATWRAVRRESELARARSEFVANVSHELRTPLTLIRMFADLLREGYASREADREKALRVIEREARSLGLLVDNVLELSSLDAGKRAFRPEAIDPAAVTAQVVSDYRPYLEREGFRIGTRIDREAPPVLADREALEQAIRNLLGNAVKYSPDRREIEVAVRRDGRGVRIEVADRGLGLELGEEHRVFERYYRTRRAAGRAISGTGIGLAIVYRFAREHGGRVHAAAREGGGTRFVLELPEAPRESEEGS